MRITVSTNCTEVHTAIWKHTEYAANKMTAQAWSVLVVFIITILVRAIAASAGTDWVGCYGMKPAYTYT